MSHDFRTERVDIQDGLKKLQFLKVFAKSNVGLPLDIDIANRFAVYASWGEQHLEIIQNLEVRKDDVWVITTPKCGTKWMLELVWLLLNDLDYETALKVDQEVRAPFLEYYAENFNLKPISVDVVKEQQSPRVIKSHLPMHILPKQLWTVKPKIVYVAREPKDAAVSFYYHSIGLGLINTTMNEFFNMVLNDLQVSHPFWPHVVEFWKLRNEPYLYFTSFERMKKDLRSIVLQVSEFLNKPINDEQMEKLVDHLSFEKMKSNPMCNHLKESRELREVLRAKETSFRFMRKGEVGSHKVDMTEDIKGRFEEWTEKALKPYGVTSEEILIS